MNRLHRILVLLSVICLLPFASQSVAQIVNGFEPGDPAVTTKVGDGSTQGTYFGVAPAQGLNQFLITTIASADGDGFSPVSGTDAVSNFTLQSFFFGVGPSGTEGSGFQLTFTVPDTMGAPDAALTFQYDFLTNEFAPGNHNDIAYAMLFDSSDVLLGGVQTITTANLAQPGLTLLSDQSGPFQFHTGYQTFSISLVGLAPGTYTLGIGIQDRTTFDIPSGLLVDNVFLIVPEASTIGLGIAGAVLLIALRSRFRKA